MYKMIAVTDETNTCECCGKNNLKRVVVLENVETGTIVRYGVDCAAKAMRKIGQTVKSSELKSEADALSIAQRWMTAGHSAEVISNGLWNKFGFLTEVKNGKVNVTMSTGVVVL